MPFSPPSAAPVLIFQGGTDALQLAPDGPVYHPGDPMPESLSDQQRIALQATGIRFFTRHPEPAPAAAQPKKGTEA